MLKDASKSQKISIFAQTLTSFMENNIPQEWNKFYLKDVSFVNLMMRRIYNVLIVANPYDAFMLEDDGRIEEKIYNEYMEPGAPLSANLYSGFYYRRGCCCAAFYRH